MKAKRLSVEGNIAVGKSTFLRLLSRVNPDWSLVTEPLKKWQNIQTTAQPQDFSQDMGNLLQLIYKDPARWSYTFQTFSCLSRFRIQIEPLPEQLLKIKEPVQIFERSIYSDRYVFALTLSKLGHMNAVEWAMYQEWHSFLMQEFDERVALDGIVYLRANPEKCFERLQKRAREEEMTVQQNYLENLHEQHENWLARKTTNVQFQKVKNIPVLMLDVNEDFENNSDASDLLSHKVKDFIADL
ncbi:deoxyguanosine kinase, mitochondrial isoform X2 [Bombina bombina]|nr:deoxyguanosine kinase, mitochondrial isoform X2 [Bombina bombina]